MLRYQSANQAGLSTADVKKLASSLLIKGYIWELERLSRSHFPADQLMMGMMSRRLLMDAIEDTCYWEGVRSLC
jgi:hypothetical protein